MATIEEFPVPEAVKGGWSGPLIGWMIRMTSAMRNLIYGSGFVFPSGNRAMISGASGGLEESIVTSTELEKLDGVTANVQTQLNAKVPYTGASAQVDLNDQDLLNVDNLSADTATFGGATDYSEFEADGTLKFNGGATVWDDSMTPAFGARTAAADLALQLLTGGIYAPRYDLNDEVFQCVQFPHSIKTSGTVTIKAHVHLVNQNSIGATGYNVAFDLEYVWGNIGSVLSGSSQSDKRVSFQNTAALTHKMLVFDDVVAGAGQGGISSLFFCRLKRVAAGAEAYNTNDIFYGGFDIHFEKDTVGSREPASK